MTRTTIAAPDAKPDEPRAAGRGLFFLLIAGMSLGPLAINILMPAMPNLVRSFGTSVEAVQLTLSLYLVGLAVSQLAHGPLSDQFGRRPVMIGGFALTMAASLAAPFATGIEWIVAARIAQACGASTGLVIGRAIIRDLYDRDEAAAMIGWVTLAMLVVPMLAPTVGGLLDTAFGWGSIFLFVGLFAAALVTWTIASLPETRAQAHAGGGLRRFRRDAVALLTDRMFIGYALSGAFASATFFSFLGGAPHVVVTMMGHTSAEYGVWFAVAAASYAAGNFVTARWSVRLGSAQLALWGCILAAAGGALTIVTVLYFPVSAGPAVIFVPQLLMSFANGLMLPNIVAGAVSVRPEAAGSAAGIAGFLQMGLSAGMAQLVGHFLAGAATPLPMAIVLALCAVGALVAFVGFIPPARQDEV